jgi:hypothetical protein
LAVKKAAAGRHFVPDEEVHKIVHNVHSELESGCKA